MHIPQNPIALFDVGGPEVMMIFLVVLLLFGGKKMPELARGLGKSIREFKKATAGVEEEIKKAIEAPPEPTHTPVKTIKSAEPTQAAANPFLAAPTPTLTPAESKPESQPPTS
ncbi:MAG: twin-arginine translocase TatA/TatE family subunit [Nibricoccus sp.]